jgi:hypothetical protein
MFDIKMVGNYLELSRDVVMGSIRRWASFGWVGIRDGLVDVTSERGLDAEAAAYMLVHTAVPMAMAVCVLAFFVAVWRRGVRLVSNTFQQRCEEEKHDEEETVTQSEDQQCR